VIGKEMGGEVDDLNVAPERKANRFQYDVFLYEKSSIM
jgi:hypothetical protein